MPASLPYLASPGIVDTAFRRIKEAATPERFTNDFVSAVLRMRGGAGRSIPPFLKKLGLLNTDGTPTALYHRFRNESSYGSAVAEASRTGYRPLYRANEYAHEVNDAELKGLILEVTGLERDNSVAKKIFSTFKKLCSHAVFDEAPDVQEPTATGEAAAPGVPATRAVGAGGRAMNLSYTINLNLPPSTNIEVFNAIFKSLREHLLND